jgi:hypothetical protein
MDTQEFTRNEWLSYAGAESWSTQKLPLIGRGKFESGKEFEIVFDHTGACLIIEDHPCNVYGGHVLDLAFPTQAAAEVFAKGIIAPKSLLDFLALGFREL